MLHTILSITVMGLLALTALAQDTPQVTFNDAGLSSLKFRGRELLEDGAPGTVAVTLDTNGIYQPFGEKGDFPWRLLQADVWKRLAEKHPDVLLIPELLHGDGSYHAAYWAYCAQYMELDYGGVWRTPERIKRLFPDAISCVVMKDAKGFEQKRQDLVDAVRGGDILLFRGWFDDSINAKVKSVYADAAKAARPPPD